MTEKHPEDMTAGELLRWAAENDKLRMRCDMCMKLYRMDSCGGHDCNDWLIDLADKIDAEIEEARIRYFLENLDTRIEKYGYPSRIERELFDEWINRCFIQRPLDEAGEPVREGSETCYGTVSYIDVEVSDTCWGNWGVHLDDGDRIEGTFSQRVERHEPDSLEKAMERFQGILEDHDGLEPETEGELWDVHRRLTALMERGA